MLELTPACGTNDSTDGILPLFFEITPGTKDSSGKDLYDQIRKPGTRTRLGVAFYSLRFCNGWEQLVFPPPLLYLIVEAKADARGGIKWETVVTKVEESAPSPREYSILQAYPNPFNSTTIISFTIPRREHVTLTVFDVLGGEVARLVDRELDVGEHSVNFNAEWIPSGVYFAQMKAGNVVQRIKMVLVK
jgi:hypothetical protein